jgi:hypothetical protein
LLLDSFKGLVCGFTESFLLTYFFHAVMYYMADYLAYSYGLGVKCEGSLQIVPVLVEDDDVVLGTG